MSRTGRGGAPPGTLAAEDRSVQRISTFLVFVATGASALAVATPAPFLWVGVGAGWGLLSGHLLEPLLGGRRWREELRALAPGLILPALLPRTLPEDTGGGPGLLLVLMLSVLAIACAAPPGRSTWILRGAGALAVLVPLSFRLDAALFLPVAAVIALASLRLFLAFERARFADRHAFAPSSRRRRTSRRREVASGPGPGSPARGSLARLAVAATWFAVLLFLVLPRFTLEDLTTPGHRGEREAARADETDAAGDSSGDSGGRSVSLDVDFELQEQAFLSIVGRLSENDDPVLSVRLRDRRGLPYRPHGQWVYLRSLVLDRYAAGGWLHSEMLPDPARDEDDGRTDGWTRFPEPPPSDGEIVLQEIEHVPLGTAAVFAMPAADRVRVPEITVDGSGNAYFPEEPTRPVRYSVVSRVRRADDPPREGTRPPFDSARYRTPPGVGGLPELARSLAQGHATRFDLCRAVERHLLAEYTYSYEFDPGESDPIEHFLFESRSGYCVHFASAMIAILRALDVPARMATGFTTSEEGPQPGTFVARARDAHAWVEAYFDGYGWISFDPTPPRPWQESIEEVPLSERILAFVRGFGDRQRRQILDGIGAGLAHPASWIAIAVLALLLLRLRGRGTRPTVTSVDRRTRAFYEEFLARLARAGIRRGPGETPAELARRAAGRFPPWAVDRVTRAFCDVRYGKRELDEAGRAAIRAALAALVPAREEGGRLGPASGDRIQSPA